MVGGISVRSRVGCWRTITACVTTKLTVICSHHGQGRMENINKDQNKKKKAKPKKQLIMLKMDTRACSLSPCLPVTRYRIKREAEPSAEADPLFK